MPLTALHDIHCHLAGIKARLSSRPPPKSLTHKNIFGEINKVCQTWSIIHHRRMKPHLWIPAFCALTLTLALSSCGNSGSRNSGPQATTGPFDRNGRYIEEWADNPSKWRKPGTSPSPHETKSDELPEIAKNDQPPQNSNPLPPANTSKPVPVISHTPVATKPTTEKPQEVAVKSKHPAEKPQEVVVKSKHPAEKSKEVAEKSKRPAEKSKEVAVKSKRHAVKSEEVAVHSKAKAKPKSSRYLVKNGDSLSSIASRTGSSISAIKSANDISGSMIRPGQSLTIPKH
jgi:LysM repeat protein